MLIKFEKEIEHCMECPFKEQVREMGYSGYECSLLGCYATIPSIHIRNDCPFNKTQSEV
jgi:hypothetical protein